jgi:hypothetical protein
MINWASNIGAISAASPNAYAAIGRPRLPALTYAEQKAAMTVSPASRFHSTRASRTAMVAATATLPSEAIRFADSSRWTSVPPSTVIMRAGLAT